MNDVFVIVSSIYYQYENGENVCELDLVDFGKCILLIYDKASFNCLQTRPPCVFIVKALESEVQLMNLYR